MILAEMGFVIRVTLLQFFPVIEPVSLAATVMPTATVASMPATAVTSPTSVEIAPVIVATSSAELPPASVMTQPAVLVMVALPNTDSDAWLDEDLYPVPLPCIGGRLVVWLLACMPSRHDRDAGDEGER